MADQAIDWDFPDVFIPGLGPERYIGIKGGRGSGKSQFVGGLIPIRMMQGKNALCIREVQSTTADSSKSMIEKQIIKHGLSAHFNVLDKEIRCIATGAKAIFRGMQSYNAANPNTRQLIATAPVPADGRWRLAVRLTRAG